MSLKHSLSAFALLGAVILLHTPADACTRLVYTALDNQIITARSMDWSVDIGTNLWIFPRGMQRTGQPGTNSLNWTSQYGSVIASAYDVSTADGLNEAGLSASVLWLEGSAYPKDSESKPGLSIAAWAQYVLDNFATVNEVVAAMESGAFTVFTAKVPGQDRLADLHLAVSDPTGDSAIFEYIDGKLVVHHGKQYPVMTNAPAFDQQLALNTYWQQIGGLVMLPGTNRASDRFARAAFYVQSTRKSADMVESLAAAFSIIRNVSVPFGIATPDQPNLSSTRWRTVADQKRLIYFFESALTPNAFWVDFKKIDFSAQTGRVKKLDLGPNQSVTYEGDTSALFKDTPPFRFLGR